MQKFDKHGGTEKKKNEKEKEKEKGTKLKRKGKDKKDRDPMNKHDLCVLAEAEFIAVQEGKTQAIDFQLNRHEAATFEKNRKM